MPATLFARAVVRRSIVLLATLQAIASLTVACADGLPTDGRLPDIHGQESESANRAWSDDAPRSVSAAAAELALSHVQSGFRLGRRGAFYSARLEFVSALRMLTQALDAPTHGTPHAEALARGFRALQESDDFVPRGLDLETELDLAGIVAIHRTPILKDRSASELTSLIALRHYYTYAQQQLAAAAGREPVGSMAFYGLARVETALGRQEPNRHPAASPKAITLHQASLLVDQHNYAAANELGVLLVRHGRLVEAQQIFQHSLDAAPTRAAWQNLAALHRKLGQPELAAIADEQARALAAGPTGRGPRVAGDGASPAEWLDPAQFARSRPGKGPLGRKGQQPDR
ncbi:MAG: tetratricopeptide repeat protein, partial [Pirellulales bacterium]